MMAQDTERRRPVKELLSARLPDENIQNLISSYEYEHDEL